MFDKKSLIKLVVMILVILFFPTMFFSYIEPEQDQANKATAREIAVVNEDLGTEFQDEQLHFGQEVIASLERDSDYKWVVVGRNAAEAGLERNQYDAVLYLPSNLSAQVMAFKEDEPEKAVLHYQIQGNLDAANMERVQRALTTARNRINSHISALYWDHVSQEVDDIRQKFDQILEREIAFQESMYAFYSPGSATIAEEIRQQMEMLEQLQAAASEAMNASSGTNAEMEASVQQMNEFLTRVQQYREFQDRQSELFLTTSLQNQQLLQQGLMSYETNLTEGLQQVLHNREVPPAPTVDGEHLLDSVVQIQQSIHQNHVIVEHIQESIEGSEVEEQFEKIMAVQEAMMKQYREETEKQSLNRLEEKLLPARSELVAASAIQAKGKAKELSAAGLPTAGQAEDVSLKTVKEQINSLYQALEAVVVEAEKPLDEIQKTITQLESNVELVESELMKQAAEQAEWEQAVEQRLETIIQEQQENVPEGKSAEERAVELIKAKEAAILQLDYLDEARKQKLASHFEQPLQSRDINQLLSYFAYLSIYEDILQKAESSDQELISEIIASHTGQSEDEVKAAFETLKGETAHFDQLRKGLRESSTHLNLLEDEFIEFAEATIGFIEEYDEVVKQEREQMMSELAAIEQGANDVTAFLREEITTPELEDAPVDGLNGELVVNTQQNAMMDIQEISNLVHSLADRHSYVNDYTNELYQRVDSVQERADQLNQSWAENVDSTRMVREDLYDVLRNAVVDGQANPYIYEYLTNPTMISGSTPEERTTHAPPVVMLIILLLCGLAIGFLVYHFSHVAPMLNFSLFMLLTLAVGLIISIYGLTIYPLHDIQVVQWTVSTILFLIACAGMIRLGLEIGPVTGGLTVGAMLIFFIAPLLDLVIAGFSIQHPVAQVFMSIQYGDQSAFLPAVIITSLLSAVVVALPYVLKRVKERRNQIEESYEEYDEVS
ncbi:type VII secretion protein EsaA [Alkalihalobacillus oceani]|uniref:type VII secretion protein EsaA n=1 Tax=Halalkalibacter oceani TaxID=1653776 RepID=UPI0020410ED8|nr:type VII secretion protein EsaA [Halalkalibacter oceani]MCM3761160.1 type VII secretion protein EsaA [Halalkalibacter oceani]